MIDPRFYELTGPLTAQVLVGGLAACALSGDTEAEVEVPSDPDRAHPRALVYLESARLKKGVVEVPAGLCLVPRGMAARVQGALAVAEVAEPRTVFARLAPRLVAERRLHTAVEGAVHATARLEADVRVGPGAVVGPGAFIGAGTDIGPNAVIGPGVAMGRGCRIGAGASVACALLGDNVMVAPNAVIGRPGFGVAFEAGRPVPVPHFGRVILQDHVGIGAATCVDRGLFGDTVIGEATQIDNLSQIAHNVEIGRNVVMAAFAGVSGSSSVGDGVLFGGRVAILDHGTVEPGARLAGGALVMHSIPAGETWGGYPAAPVKRWLREVAWLRREVHGRGDKRE
jgi:UDP-3-O-[3-hydroxymyristoyl] glucosamine N-acyltransferase